MSAPRQWGGHVWWDGLRYRRLALTYVRELKHWPGALRARPFPRYRRTIGDLSLWWGPFGLVWSRKVA